MKLKLGLKNLYFLKTLLITLFLINLNTILSQSYSINSLEKFENKISFTVNFIPVSSKFEDKEIYFPDYDDVSNSGKPNIPVQLIYVAIPKNSSVLNIESNILENLNTKNIFLSANSSILANEKNNLIYQKEELNKAVNSSSIYPKKNSRIIGYENIKDLYCVVIEIYPYQYNFNNRTLTEIKSLQLKLSISEKLDLNTIIKTNSDNIYSSLIINGNSYNNNNLSEKNNKILNNNWIDYTKEYAKFSIHKDGIYKISKEQLDDNGITTNMINPKTLKIFIGGNEIPIFVFGENDEKFDDGDYVEFFAEINYGNKDYDQIVKKGDDYKNYYNRYSDSTIAWLCWDGIDGKRIIPDGFQYISNDTLKNSFNKIHLEEDQRLWYYDASQPRTQLPFWQEHKVWTWFNLAYNSNRKFDFKLNNLVAGSSVKVNARLISHASDVTTNAHAFGISVNSTNIIDSINFNYTETVNFTNTFNSNLFSDGSNYIRIYGKKTNANFHQAELDWIDINYEQKNIAQNDSIWMKFEGENLNKISNVLVENINLSFNDIVIYRVEPSLKIIKNLQNVNTNTIVFSDTVYNNSKYLVISKTSISSPIFNKKKIFKNLVTNPEQTDYIIITNSILSNSVSEYESYIKEHYNKNVYVAFVEDIYDEFNGGSVSSESIKSFLKNAYLNWPNPKPSYVLLVGDANYDYKDVVEPAPTIRKKNLVPSFGSPVSDVWFVVFEDINENLPQMFIGRLPASSDQEVLRYLSKHKKYNDRKFDEWNKRYLFFSGGDPSNSSELEQIKNTNDFIQNNIITPAPIGGLSTHFYKTANPVTNFGPYDSEKIASEIKEGSVFISYIGHSGTQTWDNGVTEVADIKSGYDNRFSLVSDFGCSTGKFAEPDVDSFSELATSLDPNGEAIIYLGNTSLGYLSTSLSFPKLFYEQIADSILSVGELHNLAKQKLFQQLGISDVTRVFNFCNNLFGDPIIKLKVPQKPNLTIANQDFLIPEIVNENQDSISVSLKVKNLGKAIEDSVEVKVSDIFNSEVIFSQKEKIVVPLFSYILEIKIPVSKFLGEHKLKIEIDNLGNIEELDENDNIIEKVFTIYSSSLRSIEYNSQFSILNKYLTFLSPSYKQIFNSVPIQFSQSEGFDNSIEKVIKLDTLLTRLNISDLDTLKKYYFRLSNPIENKFGPISSFMRKDSEYNWFLNGSLNKNVSELNKIEYDSNKVGWKLSSKENILKISAAGANDGSFGSIIFNSVEFFPNTYYWGLATAIIDVQTLEPSDVHYFTGVQIAQNQDSLISYLDGLPDSTVVAFAISADAAQTVFGYSKGTPAREKMKEFGSFYIDSLVYRQSWCMLGKKGAKIGSVPETYHHLFEGPASISRNLSISNQIGYLVTPEISNFTKLEKMIIMKETGEQSTIKVSAIVYNKDNISDTLTTSDSNNKMIDLSGFDTEVIKKIKFLIELSTEDINQPPLFKSIELKYDGVPELATNYQVVSVEKDTVQQGEDANLQFYVYNVGESSADSFKVMVEVVKPDNSKEKIFEEVVDSIGSEKRKKFNIVYPTTNFNGPRTFSISIDTEEKVDELFEDNNFYNIPFYVVGDTSKPSINLTFDGDDIFDGEYISNQPQIKVELSDPSLVPITDTSSISIYLNNKYIKYFNNENNLKINYSSTNPKVIVDYTPTLEDGEYTLRVFGKDASGNVGDSSGITKIFNVVTDAKLLQVYNYPNPFSNDTYFTFKLTQIPDEIKIKIFTVAGRLIKEIILNGAELNYDLNKIYWDGRDEDGDLIGNGVYLYKVIMDVDGKKQDITQKLAIVR